MKMSVLILTVVTVLSLSCVASSSFSDGFPSWPQHCCPLQLQEILFGTSLPRDAVVAGNVMGKKWGYAVDRTEELMPIFISEDFRERPVRASPTHHCSTEATRTTYEVLTNPNRCVIDWYTTRYESEQFVDGSGVTIGDGRGFMPAYNGFFFARMPNTSYGDLPAVSLNGETFGCRNETFDVLTTSLPGTQVLFVDCLQSLRTMSQARLVNMSVIEEDLLQIQETPAVYFNRTYRNKSNDTKKQTISFSAMRTNMVYAVLSEKFEDSECHASKTSFARLFQTRLLDQTSLLVNSWFMRVSNRLGIDVRQAFNLMYNQRESKCQNEWSFRTNGQNNSIPVHKEVQRYHFSDDILVPGNSVTTMTASSAPYAGDARISITYELFPMLPESGSVLLTALEHFSLADRIEKSDRGTAIVHFDGSLVLDSAYEVTIHMKSHSLLAGLSDEAVLTTSQSLFPTHDAGHQVPDPISGHRVDGHPLPAGLSTLTCLVN